ncbi:MAG: hypothetical protein QXS41_03510 [Candidatus Woesearchaeota archaeon]
MQCVRCKKKESLVFKLTNQRLCKSCLSDVLVFRIKKEIRSYNFLDDDLSKFSMKAIKRKELIKIYSTDDFVSLANDINLPFYLEFLDSVFIYYLFYDEKRMFELDKLFNYSLPLKFVSLEELSYFNLNVDFDIQYNLLKNIISVDYEKLKEVFHNLLDFFQDYPGNNESLMKSIVQLKEFDLLKNPQQ